MDNASLFGVTLTKRIFILALVTSAAVLGAGFGYVLPALTGSAGPAEENVETTATSTARTVAVDEKTDRTGEEVTTDSEERVSGVQTTARTTKRPFERRTTEANVTKTQSLTTDGDSDSDPPNDERPSGQVESEVNGTIGSWPTIPSRAGG